MLWFGRMEFASQDVLAKDNFKVLNLRSKNYSMFVMHFKQRINEI